MNSQTVATIINLLAFLTGIGLYTMLLMMLLAARRSLIKQDANKLPLVTALLGLVWNLGAFTVFGLQQFQAQTPQSWIQAAAFTALGFLPAVVVHSVLRRGEILHGQAWLLTCAAYALSAFAFILHSWNALQQQPVPSHIALHWLTVGFGVLIIAMLILTRRERWWRSAGWGIALAVFAVSASHLSHHEGDNYAWWVELIGHHASLPLALVILYQDYRFALADIFLKRALALLSLVTLATGFYFLVAAPLLGNVALADPRAVGVLLSLWIFTALGYPFLKRGADWFVDKVILRRADYQNLREEVAQLLTQQKDAEELLDKICQRLAWAFTAHQVVWQVCEKIEPSMFTPRNHFLSRKKNQAKITFAVDDAFPKINAVIAVPTAEAPPYRLLIGELAGGRRLMSDDFALLEAVASMVARRIDAMRVSQERFLSAMREQEIAALAAEAELRALRAQINPHFLFNALTTIGYLIQAAPDRAVQTLLRLTGLLRGVLKRSEGEFTTLGEEVELLADYLEIEKARFENRLQVTIDVPDALRRVRIPALLLQPLVENAIKHGISPLRAGGAVSIRAAQDRDNNFLHLEISDTGAGADEQEMQSGKGKGIGLANVERRLRVHYDQRAVYKIQTAKGAGMRVEIKLPLPESETTGLENTAKKIARKSL